MLMVPTKDRSATENAISIYRGGGVMVSMQGPEDQLPLSASVACNAQRDHGAHRPRNILKGMTLGERPVTLHDTKLSRVSADPARTVLYCASWLRSSRIEHPLSLTPLRSGD